MEHTNKVLAVVHLKPDTQRRDKKDSVHPTARLTLMARIVLQLLINATRSSGDQLTRA